MPTRTWPDASTFQACAQNPAVHFRDPELARATFEPDRRRGGAQAWSGGRATVIRANRSTGGSIAVRFSKQEDQEASVRYYELSRYLSSNSISTMVGTNWTADGLRIGDEHYPVLKMDWVNGRSLDNYISKRLDAGAATADITTLAEAWRKSCRSLTDVQISHGDIHAGNTMVCDNGGRPTELRLVDYDNVWLPGLHTPVKEVGHPAFQHPRRSELSAGPDLDAVPNTLTYLSLMALAADPNLWQFHNSDDRLLFEKSDLNDPSTGVWTSILRSPDSSVASLATVTVEWLQGDPRAFRSLEQALAAAGGQHTAPPVKPRNVWRPPPRTEPGHIPAAAGSGWPPNPNGTPAPPQRQPFVWGAGGNGAPTAGPIPGAQTWQGLRPGPRPAPGLRHPGPPVPPPPNPPVQPTPDKEKHNAAAFILIAVIVTVIVIAIISGIARH